MIYETSKQKNETCNSCGYTSWKYEDSGLPHKEEICLNSACRYAMRNGRAEIMDRSDWANFLSCNAAPELTVSMT